MKYRFCRISLLITFLIVLSGCPGPRVSQGTWLFTVTDGIESAVVGVDIRIAGQAQAPDPLPLEADFGYGGTLSWAQNGQTFTLTRVQNTLTAEYIGTVDSSTSIIDGTWMDTVDGVPEKSGTWFAEKL